MSDLALLAALRPVTCRVVALVSFVIASLALPSAARADVATGPSVPVAVLPLDSDDAEEQADALTGALRSRIRASEGWSVVETSQSLAMLMAALRCTKPVGDECEQKLAEQIKSERFVFGWVTKGPTRGEVTAEVRLYQRGKPTTVVRERYADNLTDQNDDALRGIAERILEQLGENALGSIVVRMGNLDGEVIVDGSKRVALTDGTAKLALSPGGHSVEVVVPGQPPQKRNVLVAVGKETVLELPVSVEPALGESPPTAAKPFPVRAVLGGALIAAGLGAGAVSVVNYLAYEDDQTRAAGYQNDPNPQIWKLPAGKKASDVCVTPDWKQQEICKAEADAVRHSTIAIATAIGGGLLVLGGAVLLITSGSGEGEPTTTGATPKPKVAPVFGPGQGGLALTGVF